MKTWIIVPFEPVPEVDVNVRPLRYGYLASELAKRNHQVIWWTSDFNHFTKKNRYSKSVRVYINSNLSVQFLNATPYRKNISLARIRHNLSLAQSFRKIVKSSPEKPDIIFVCLPTLELAQQAVEYGKRNKIPVVVDIVDTWPDIYLTSVPNWLRPIGLIALAADFRKSATILKSATAITAVSDTYLNWGLTRASRKRRNTDKAFLLGYHIPKDYNLSKYHLIEELREKYNLSRNLFIITFLGQLASSYDVETIIYAASKLQSNQDIRFVIAGDGDKMPILKKLSRNLNNVIFTGWIDHPTALSLLHISSLGLCAYSTKALQSLPYKPFEYMACGLPLLSSLKGELADLVDAHRIGRNYTAQNVDSLVKEINFFVNNPRESEEMACNAKQLFESRFASDKIYGSLVRYLESLSL
jgi:glycosyltransferase involved in cell wall biosynthesis